MQKILLSLVLIFALPLKAEVIQVDNNGLQQLLDQGVPIIDVRTAAEWQQTGIIEGSHLLTFFDESGNYDAKAWLEKFTTLVQPEQPVVLICAVGGRTQAITHFLAQKVGYKQVHNVTAGIRAWINAGKPTTSVPKTTTTQ